MGKRKVNYNEAWLTKANDQDGEAKKLLMEAYYPQVHYVAQRMMIGLPKHVLIDDLVGFGVMGLIDAIEKFDVQRGLQFETYANWRIRGAILDGLRQGDWVPRSVREKSKVLEEAYHSLEQQYLRAVSDQEICEHLQITEKEFHQMLQETAVTSLLSLDEPLRDEEGDSRLNQLEDHRTVNPEHFVNQLFIKETLSRAIDRLTVKERTVVSLFYYEELTLSEIAEVMGLSAPRISQLHSKAILRLRGAIGRLKKQLLTDSQ